MNRLKPKTIMDKNSIPFPNIFFFGHHTTRPGVELQGPMLQIPRTSSHLWVFVVCPYFIFDYQSCITEKNPNISTIFIKHGKERNFSRSSFTFFGLIDHFLLKYYENAKIDYLNRKFRFVIIVRNLEKETWNLLPAFQGHALGMTC